jgi:hypothetical protein
VVDHNLLIKELLDSTPAVTSLLGSLGVRIGDVPEKFDPLNAPATSPCVTLCREGGDSFENAPIKTARMKIRVWAGKNQRLLANEVYGEICDALDGRNSVQLTGGFIIKCLESVGGQDLSDPDTGWATVLSYYEVTARE